MVEVTTKLDYHSLRNKKRDWLIEALVVMGKSHALPEERISGGKRPSPDMNQSDVLVPFSSGPWTWEESLDGLSVQRLHGPDGCVVEAIDEYRIGVGSDDEELIACAPELYALLAEFYDATWDSGDYSLPLTLRDRALAVLKKARGGA